MADIVNDFFRRHYPPDYADNWHTSSIGATCGRRYDGSRADTIFPAMACKDGFSMSVQGHFGAYSRPRDDFAECYTHVEVFEASEPDAILNAFDAEQNERMGINQSADRAGMDTPLGYVPVEVIARVIEAHGGLASGQPAAGKGAGG
jgi:hypothetical protein